MRRQKAHTALAALSLQDLKKPKGAYCWRLLLFPKGKQSETIRNKRETIKRIAVKIKDFKSM
jgi:hypothetical protein